MTHLCVLMANYLTGAGQRRTAVIEWNDHGDFWRMEKVCARRENVAGKKEENVFKALGVTYFGRGDADTLAGCMNGPYDDIIIDFGEAAGGVAQVPGENDGGVVQRMAVGGCFRDDGTERTAVQKLDIPGCIWQRMDQKRSGEAVGRPGVPDSVFSGCVSD